MMKEKSREEKIEFLSKLLIRSYPFLKSIRIMNDEWGYSLFICGDIDYLLLSDIINIPLKSYYHNKLINGDYNFKDGWEFLYLLFEVKKYSTEEKSLLSLQQEITNLINLLNKDFVTEEYYFNKTMHFNSFFAYRQ